MSNFTLFQSDPSSSTSGNAFDQEAFQDISLAASNNMGFSSTFSTNPLNFNLGNDDGVRYGAKTLYIKDLVLVQDHALWVNGKPTYQIIWNENYPQAQGYIFGNFQLVKDQYLSIRQIGDGIGITGVLRKCAFIVTADTAATATAQLAVDGVNTSTINFSDSPYPLIDPANSIQGAPLQVRKYATFVNSSSNQTRNIHDYRLTALQTNTLRLVGVVVYSENSGANVDILPGVTYSNKTRVATTLGATLPLPSYTGALGGRALYYKTQAGGYTVAIEEAPNLQSIATGSSGTNLVNVTTGTGASFPIGSGFAAFFGSTGFLGSVTNQSTDTLTVSPTLPFGVSGLIYKTWQSGQSLAIQSSFLVLSSVIDAAKLNYFDSRSRGFYDDPQGQYRLNMNGLGASLLDTIWPALIPSNVTLGFIQVDGYFSAADIEFVGQGVLHATFSVNGHPAFSVNAGQTGCLKKTVFTDAGPGWNSFFMNFGASFAGVGINRINLYQRQLPPGISYGILAAQDTLPTFVNQPANATYMSLGTYRRYYADQLFMQGGWTRVDLTGVPGQVVYTGFSTNCVLNFQYYGSNFAVLGINAGQSMTIAVDGGAATAVTLGVMSLLGGADAFHTVVLTNRSGTAQIHGVDITRAQGEIMNLQNYCAYSKPTLPRIQDEVWVAGPGGLGGVNTAIRYFDSSRVRNGSAISYLSDTSYGDAFVIAQDGLYAITYVDLSTGTNQSISVTLNSNQLTLDPTLIRQNDIISYSFLGPVTGAAGMANVTCNLKAGDILRAHAGASFGVISTIGAASFRVVKIG